MEDAIGANARLVKHNEQLVKLIRKLQEEKEDLRMRFGVAKETDMSIVDIVERYGRTIAVRAKMDELREAFDNGAVSFRNRVLSRKKALTESVIMEIRIKYLENRP